MARRPLLYFVPFAVVSVAHLIGLVISSYLVVHVTKPLIAPTLLLALVLWTGLPLARVIALPSAALFFSLAGDVLLSMPGDLGFLIGLGCFFAAHLCYLVVFATRLRVRRIPLAAIVFLVWFVGLLALLAPYLGALLVPVAAYGLALGASAAVALACNRFVAIGAATFLVSDTLLAFKLFYPDFTFWQIDPVIMLLYCTGQGLIVFGIARSLATNRAVRVRESVSA